MMMMFVYLVLCQTEGIALAQAADLPADKLLTVLDQGAMSNPMFRMKVSVFMRCRTTFVDMGLLRE